METVRPCACKGIRTCLICEEEYSISRVNLAIDLKKWPSYVYCPDCNKAWPGWDFNLYKQHPNHTGTPIDFPGIYIQLNFLNLQELKQLINDLDLLPWEQSQSGRRKQNFGPKTNFKKRRIRPGNFIGFPESTKFIQDKFKLIPELKDFKTVEQCSLEYDPKRGSSIDPHIDDCWIWGERIVTVNVLGDSVLSMMPYRGTMNRYNLDCVQDALKGDLPEEDILVRLPMPAGSLMILSGAARYQWEHAVLREDITSRRICLAYRELTPPYLPDEKGNCCDETIEVLERALNFW